MHHPILGNITTDGDDVHLASVSYGDRDINFRIDADATPFEAAVELAASVAQEIPALDVKAKQVAALELTDTYNNAWHEDEDEIEQDDGTYETVSVPELTQHEFAKKLTLTSVNVVGNTVEFFYDDANMFGGHSVIVSSMDGIGFTNTHAELYG